MMKKHIPQIILVVVYSIRVLSFFPAFYVLLKYIIPISFIGIDEATGGNGWIIVFPWIAVAMIVGFGLRNRTARILGAMLTMFFSGFDVYMSVAAMNYMEEFGKYIPVVSMILSALMLCLSLISLWTADLMRKRVLTTHKAVPTKTISAHVETLHDKLNKDL